MGMACWKHAADRAFKQNLSAGRSTAGASDTLPTALRQLVRGWPALLPEEFVCTVCRL